MVARDDANRMQLPLPCLERVEDVLGQAEREEAAQSLIAAHAIRQGHTELSGLCVSRRRTRWSAPTTERARIEARSPGKLNSRPRPPSGPSACRYTRPTGFSGLPPSGPAMPVTETATSAPSRA